mgnify:CR=1 FL=1
MRALLAVPIFVLASACSSMTGPESANDNPTEYAGDPDPGDWRGPAPMGFPVGKCADTSVYPFVWEDCGS